MKPLITTVNALRELSTGLSPEAISTSVTLFQFDTSDYAVLLAADDDQSVQRILVWREAYTKDQFVPDHLRGYRRDTLSRMASFAERMRIPGVVSLPRAWHQYKFKSFVAFFAVPGVDERASRWITELCPGPTSDVIFWQTTTSNKKETLQEFSVARPSEPKTFDDAWREAFTAAQEYFDSSRRRVPADTEIYLDTLEQSPTRGRTYHDWQNEISPDQRDFLDSSTSRSVRLRGPAGSGKTLALTLKAIREVLAARSAGEQIRVLVATHSWALAAQIDEALRSMGVGDLPEIDVFPLLEIAKSVSPHYASDSSGVELLGDDSFSGKRAQLDEILDVLSDFVSSDWVTYSSKVSAPLRMRLDSNDADEKLALAWDLLTEFGSVIGAAAIFPGAGSELKYFQLDRAGWMLPLPSKEDQRIVFRIYEKYMKSLEMRSLITSDQVLSDFLSHLETHAWNRARKAQGYDLVFVDELHLFSPLERQVLHYLTRDVSSYPRIFMAFDPRQSPSEAFIGVAADETRSSTGVAGEDHLGDVANFELTTVHRFTPQILSLIKHVHHEFPTLDLGRDWDIDFAAVESSRTDGPAPRLVTSASRNGEEDDIGRAIHELYSKSPIALAIVDSRQWNRFSAFASRLGQSAKFHVSTISGRSEIEGLGYRSRGLVVAPAEYLAGLQFRTVLVAGIPDLRGSIRSPHDRTKFLSHLYLAISRAEYQVRIFVNDDDGGMAEVLERAVTNDLVVVETGSRV